MSTAKRAADARERCRARAAKVGRPATHHVAISVRILPDQLSAVDAIAIRQLSDRSTVVRQLLARALVLEDEG